MAASGSQQSALGVLTETITKSVLAAINDKMAQNNQNLLTEVKGLINESTAEITEKAAKRIRTENPEMSNPGNKQQFQHNTDVLHTIERAANAVVKGDGEAAIAALNEGKQAVTHRNKLVRLADREEKGWRFVQEYLKDNLADDTDDEKQIKRARKAVQEKHSSRGRGYQPTRGAGRGRGYNRRGGNFRQDSWNHQYQRGGYNSRGYRGGDGQRTDFRRNRFDRQCFKCGRRGHLSYSCSDRDQR